MNKKLIAILTLCVILCIALFGLNACSNDDSNNENGNQTPPTHIHVYNQKVVNNDYLKSYATTTEKAKYYYSCECGEKGTNTFEHGEFEKPPTEGLVFTLINNDTECSVIGYEGASTEVYIPATYKGLPVTSIGDRAFYNCSSLTSIKIPDSVTSIGDYAFYYCDSLTSITIPDSVTSIGDYAFYYCDSLQYNIKDGLKYLGNDNNKYLYLADTVSTYITTANIDTNCRFIGDYAFSWCSSLTRVTIGNSVTSIGSYAFAGCRSLTSVTIGNSVTSIGHDAFDDCDSLQYNEKDGLKYLGNESNKYLYFVDTVSTDITTVNVDSNCRFVDYNAFDGCSLLINVTIPNGATPIGSVDFYNCSSLTSVTILDGVTFIGSYAFYYCSSLTSITIPDSVTSISNNAFYNCSSLTSITIGNSVTSIGEYAFSTLILFFAYS